MNNISQEDVYAQVGEQMKEQFLGGNAVVMFAYGLSGSGKTFSVFGPDMIGMPEAWFNFDTPHKFWGIFPRLAYDIMTKEAPRRGGEWVMSIKYFQNVVDRILDLLSGEDENEEDHHDGHKTRHSSSPSHSSSSRNLKHTNSSVGGIVDGVEDRHINDGFHKDSHGFVDITWCRKKTIKNWTDLIATFKTANAKKAIAPTQFNPASTRGHCILVFEAEMPHPTKRGVRRAGRLYVCDLAGAEPAASVHCAQYERVVTESGNVDYVYKGRHPKQSKTDELVKQGKKINLSLSEMTGFFRQMAKLIKNKKFNESRPIPGCRTYFLGKFLKNTLMHAQTYLFAGVRPEIQYQTFTASTLAFAENASVVKLKPKRMDSHDESDSKLGGADDHGLYASENTLDSLHEKLRVMHDVVSGRRFLNHNSLQKVTHAITQCNGLEKDIQAKLLTLTQKGNKICAAAMLNTLRHALMGNNASDIFSSRTNGKLFQITEENDEENDGENDNGENGGNDTEIDIIKYNTMQTELLLNDRLSLEERANMITHLEKMETDDTGTTVGSVNSNGQKTKRARKASTMSTNTENLLFLVDHQKVSTAHAVMLCSGKNAAQNILKMSHRPPTEDDDEEFEDAAVFGESTYLPLALNLISDIGKLISNGGNGGNGGNGSNGSNGNNGSSGNNNKELKDQLKEALASKTTLLASVTSSYSLVSTLQEDMLNEKKEEQKLQLQLKEVTEAKENMEIINSMLQTEITNVSDKLNLKEKELIEVNENYNTMEEMVEKLSAMSTEATMKTNGIKEELKESQTQHTTDTLLIEKEEKMLKSARLILIWKEYLIGVKYQKYQKEMEEQNEKFQKEKEKTSAGLSEIENLKMTIDMLTMTMTESMIETESKNKEIETQTNALMELNLMLASSQNELKESNEKIQTMSTQEKELEKKLDLVETKNQNFKKENQKQKKELFNDAQTIEMLTMTMTEQSMTSDNTIQTLIQQNETLKSQLNQTNDQLNNKTTTVDTLESNLKERNEELIILRTKLNTSKTLNITNQSTIHELEHMKENIAYELTATKEQYVLMTSQLETSHRTISETKKIYNQEKKETKKILNNNKETQKNLNTILEEKNKKIEDLELKYVQVQQEWKETTTQCNNISAEYSTYKSTSMTETNALSNTLSDVKNNFNQKIKTTEIKLNSFSQKNLQLNEAMNDMNESNERNAIEINSLKKTISVYKTHEKKENEKFRTMSLEMMAYKEEIRKNEIVNIEQNNIITATKEKEEKYLTKNILKFQEKEKEIETLQSTIDALEQESKETTAKWNELQQEALEWETDRISSEKMCHTLSSENVMITTHLNQLIQTMEHIENSLKKAQTELEVSRLHINEYETTTKTLLNDKNMLEDTLSSTLLHLNTLTNEHDASVTLSTNEKKMLTQQLTQMKQQQEEDVEENKNKLKTRQRKKQKEMENLSLMEQDLKEANDKIQTLTSTSNRLINEQSDCFTELENMKIEMNERENIFEQKKKENDQIKKDNNTLQQEISNQQMNLSKLENFKQFHETNEQSNKKFQTKYEHAEERIRTLLLDNNTINENNLTFKTKLATLESQNSELEIKLKSTVSSKDKVIATNEINQNKNNALESEISKLKQSNMIHVREKTSHQTEIASIKQQNEKKQSSLNSKINIALKNVEHFKNENMKLQNTSNVNQTQFKQQLKELTKNLETLNQELIVEKEQLQDTIDLHKKSEEECLRIKNIHQQYIQQTKNMDNTVRNDLKNSIQEVHEHRESIRLIKDVVKQTDLKMKRLEEENDMCRKEHEMMSTDIIQKEKEFIEMKNNLFDVTNTCENTIAIKQNQMDHMQHLLTESELRMKEMVQISETIKQDRINDKKEAVSNMNLEQNKYFQQQEISQKKEKEKKELQTQIDTMKREQMTIQNEQKDMHDKCLRIEKENKQLIQENVSEWEKVVVVSIIL